MTYRYYCIFIFFLTFCFCNSARSQHIERNRMIGVAHTNVLDTYLSPLEYTGTSVQYHASSLRALNDSLSAWQFQHSCWGNIGFVSNPTDDCSEWDGQLQLDWAWRYRFECTPQFNVSIGPMIEVGAGFTYNLKGGNNPAQGRLSIAAGASAAARYAFSCFKKNMAVNGRIDLPMLGAAFSPHYGQSYYEIFSLGHYDNNVVVTHPFNAPTARMLFTLEIPFKKSALLVGYWGEARQSKLHHLKRHTWTNGLMIGYAATFLRCSR